MSTAFLKISASRSAKPFLMPKLRSVLMQSSPQKRPLPEDETEPEVWKYLEHTPTDYESKKHIRLRNAKTFLRIAKERENIKVGGNFFVVSERLTDTVLQDIELPPPPLPPVEILPLPPSPASLPFQAENSPNRPEKSANTTSFEKISVEFKENNMSENPVSPVDPSDRLRSRRRWIFDNDSQVSQGVGNNKGNDALSVCALSKYGLNLYLTNSPNSSA